MVVLIVLAIVLLGSPGMSAAQDDPLIEVETLARGLEAPWALAFAPDGRLFITERPGRVRVFRNGRLEEQPASVLPVASVAEAGLLGLAIGPSFEQDRLLYAVHSYRTAGGEYRNRLVRLREDRSTGRIDQDRVLLEGVLGGGNHNGGRLRLGPDRKLYWAVGDAGKEALAQDPASPNGKILRLETDGSIPGDNPLRGSAVYSLGHRNPQGLAWQPGTGALFSTEHGPSGSQGCCRDEVNRIQPGGNYGWPLISGVEHRPGLVTPFWHSGPDDTWAPSGATFVSSGSWAGSLVFTGLRGQALYRLVMDRSEPERMKLERHLPGRYGRLRDVVEGPDGALYVITNNRDGVGTPGPEDDRLLRIRVRS